jgi:hypothetical protein
MHTEDELLDLSTAFSNTQWFFFLPYDDTMYERNNE